jgi:hypothetical protein
MLVLHKFWDISNVTRMVISINERYGFDGTVLITPILVNANDSIKIRVNKPFSSEGIFKLKGKQRKMSRTNNHSDINQTFIISAPEQLIVRLVNKRIYK